MYSMEITARELSEDTGLDYVTANGILRYMTSKGTATICGKRKPNNKTGRGKPTNVYEVPAGFILDFLVVLQPVPFVDEPIETVDVEPIHDGSQRAWV